MTLLVASAVAVPASADSGGGVAAPSGGSSTPPQAPPPPGQPSGPTGPQRATPDPGNPCLGIARIRLDPSAAADKTHQLAPRWRPVVHRSHGYRVRHALGL